MNNITARARQLNLSRLHGIVYPDINLAESLLQWFSCGKQGPCVGNINRRRGNLNFRPFQLPLDCFESGRVLCNEPQTIARLRKPQRKRTPDSCRSAGNDHRPLL
jgi:hypothetical protein